MTAFRDIAVAAPDKASLVSDYAALGRRLDAGDLEGTLRDWSALIERSAEGTKGP